MFTKLSILVHNIVEFKIFIFVSTNISMCVPIGVRTSSLKCDCRLDISLRTLDHSRPACSVVLPLFSITIGQHLIYLLSRGVTQSVMYQAPRRFVVVAPAATLEYIPSLFCFKGMLGHTFSYMWPFVSFTKSPRCSLTMFFTFAYHSSNELALYAFLARARPALFLLPFIPDSYTP